MNVVNIFDSQDTYSTTECYNNKLIICLIIVKYKFISEKDFALILTDCWIIERRTCNYIFKNVSKLKYIIRHTFMGV